MTTLRNYLDCLSIARCWLAAGCVLAALTAAQQQAAAQGKPFDVTFINSTGGPVQMWVVSFPKENLGVLPNNMSDTIDFNLNEQVNVYRAGTNVLLGQLTVRQNTTVVIGGQQQQPAPNPPQTGGGNGGGFPIPPQTGGGGNGGNGGGAQPLPPQNGGGGGTQPAGSTLNIPSEIQDAINYLNQIRQNPAFFGQQLGVDLSSVTPRKPLSPNATLQQVAQRKADWMAANDPGRSLASVVHVMTIGGQTVGMNRWMREAGWNMPIYAVDSMSHFESLWAAGGSDPVQAGVGRRVINTFVQEGITGGHAQHVLGLNFHADNTEIGIGMATSPDGKFIYVSLLAWPKN